MTYSIKTIIWQSYTIEVRYAADPFNMASHNREAMSHIEIRTITPENAAIPITETGYKSHFIPKIALDDYETPEAFVKAWLDHDARSADWRDAEENARQMSLNL